MHEDILTGLVLLFALGAVAQWSAWRFRVPSILMLLIVGFVAGPVTGFVDPDALLGPVTFPLVSLGAAVVLFEGGLTASWQDIRSVVTPVRRLISIGILVTGAGLAVAAHLCLGLEPELALLLGAILVVTGPTVVGPLLRHARPHGPVGSILKFEGILNDPLGAVLAVLVFQVIEAEQMETAVSLVALGVAKTAVVSFALGLFSAWLYVAARAREWLPEFLENAVLLPIALGVYALANHSQHESGLLAVTVMGIALASQRRVSIETSLEFTAHARTMLISILFVLLTARMDLADIMGLPWGSVAFVAVAIFVVRPLAVFVSTLGTDLSWRERIFLAAMAPRGIVAAAVSSVFALRLVDAGYPDAAILMPITFLLIAVCVAVYGLLAAPLVGWLALGQVAPNGVLMLGANHIARVVAKALVSEGIRVVLVDSDRAKVLRARQAGLEAVHGRLLSEPVLTRLDLDDIGHLVALTSNDDANTLAAAHFRKVFGDTHVHQLAATPSGAREHATRLRGQPFAGGRSFEDLSDLVRRGAVCEITPVTETSPIEDHERTDRLPLFAISKDATLRVLGQGSPPLQIGERVIDLGVPTGQ